jgi:TP901 family phage tail tape measure protein
MSEVRNLYVKLSANVGSFRGQMVAAGADVRKFGTDVVQTAERNKQFARSLSTIGLVAGGVMAAGLILGVRAQIQLEQAMRNVATISDEIGNHLGFYTDQIVRMSTEVPQSAKSLADGLYDIVSSGFDGAQAMDILRVSAKGASAGLTDTATSAKAILTVLNAYGLSAAHAGDVSDILFQAVNKGVMTYEQLASAMGNVVPTAAAAGVKFDDMASALAAITLSGLTADEAATSLNQTINKILAPSATMERAIHQIGYQSGYAAIQGLGLHGVITKLAKSQGTAADTALTLFPEIRAARGFMALTAAAGKNYASTFGSIANQMERAGAAQKAYQTQSQATATQLKLLENNVTALGIEAGQVLAPGIKAAVAILQDFTGMLDAMPGPMKELLTILAALGAAGLLTGAAFLRISTSLKGFLLGLREVTTASAAARVAMTGLKLSMGILGIALIAATAVYGAYTASKQRAKESTDAFVAALQQEQQGVKNASLTELANQMVKDGTWDKLKASGADLQTMIGGVTGDSKDWAAANKELDNSFRGSGIFETSDTIKRLRDEYDAGTISQSEYNKGLLELRSTSGHFTDEQEKSRKTYDDLRGDLKGYRDHLSDARDITKLMADAQDKATDASLRFSPALVKLEQHYAPVIDGTQQLDDVTKALGKTFDSMSDPMSALQAAMKDGKASLQEFTDALNKQIVDMQNYATNLALLAKRGRTALVEQFIKMGPQASGLVAQAVTASGSELDRLERLFGKKATLSTIAFRQGLNVLPIIAASKGRATVDSLSKAFNLKAPEMVAMLKVLRDSINDVPTKRQINLILQHYRETKAGLDGVTKAAQRVPPSTKTKVQIEGEELAKRQLRLLKDLLRGVEGPHLSTITVQTRHIGIPGDPADTRSGKHNATGGLYAPVEHFSEGHNAYIGGGTTRVWSEPETLGEAYIPLAPGVKRARAKAILGNVAHRFGLDVTPRGSTLVAGSRAPVVIVQTGGGDRPLVGSLTVPAMPGEQAGPVIREVMYQLRRYQRGGRHNR